jgi:peptidoglycan/LPS O-acetylase OafA/YrhL
VLVLAFLSGVLSFQYSNRIKLGLPGLVLALWLALVTLSIGQLYAFSILPLTYITVWLGLTTPPKNNLLLRGDYSYGIYLFGYPVQQLAVSWFPDRPYWWFNLFVSLPLIFACAIFSWHIIEKPILARRKIIADFVVNLFSRQSSPL